MNMAGMPETLHQNQILFLRASERLRVQLGAYGHVQMSGAKGNKMEQVRWRVDKRPEQPRSSRGPRTDKGSERGM